LAPDPAELARLVAGAHHNPHSILGAHEYGDHTVIRAFRPHAVSVVALVGDVAETEVAEQAVATAHGRFGGLDVLVNNAGILGNRVSPAETTPADLEHVFATNVFAVVRVTEAFLPLLRASGAPVIVNVSSGMGSFAVTSNPERVEFPIANLTYSPSKAALTLLTTQWAKALPEVRINAVDPGYTATEFNGHSGHQTVTEGTDAIVAMAQIGPDGPTGTFIDRDGTVPW